MKYEISLRVHFMGIGGSGVSSLASILHEKGLIISGCDQTPSPFTEKLLKEGIDVKIGHSPKHITEIDLLIHTSAINKDHPELAIALKNNIPTLSYSQALGQLTKEIETIAICGTHGKTTTTAFTYFAFKSTKTNPALIVGSTIPQLNNINGAIGEGKLLIIEACEYQRHFLNYHPKTVLITNLEIDHLDYFKDQSDYTAAFHDFTLKIPKNGNLVVNGDDQNIQKLLQILAKEEQKYKITTFGQNQKNDYYLENGIISHKGIKLANLDIQLPGKHNQMNALAAFVLAHIQGSNPEQISKGLSIFKGTSRRMELLGEYKGSLVYDDYAHHPSEIKATLNALKEMHPSKKILTVFQPHQYSRTHLLQDQFAEAFTDSDKVIISDIYESRDTTESKKSITAEKLANKISAHHPNTEYGGSIDKILTTIRTQKDQYDIIVTLGAGDIWELSHQLSNQ